MYIPKNYEKYCSRRVITMEFVKGIKIDDLENLKKHFDTRQIGSLLVKIFAKMIFLDGHVHCDAHPGNIFVRKVNNRPQIVLLDHGFYCTLEKNFHENFNKLWFSMCTFDNK